MSKLKRLKRVAQQYHRHPAGSAKGGQFAPKNVSETTAPPSPVKFKVSIDRKARAVTLTGPDGQTYKAKDYGYAKTLYAGKAEVELLPAAFRSVTGKVYKGGSAAPVPVTEPKKPPAKVVAKARPPAGKAPKSKAGTSVSFPSEGFDDAWAATVWLNRKYRGCQFDLEGLDAEMATRAARTFDEVMTTFPFLEKTLKVFSTQENIALVTRSEDNRMYHRKYFEEKPGVYGFHSPPTVSAGTLPNSTVSINPAFFESRAEEESAERRARDRVRIARLAGSIPKGMDFHPITGRGLMEDVIIHELGHAVEAYIRGAAPDLGNELNGAYKAFRDNWFKESDTFVSSYAGTNDKEMFAETFMAVFANIRRYENASGYREMEALQKALRKLT